MKRSILIPAALALALQIAAGSAIRAQTPNGNEQTLLGAVQTALAAKDWASAESGAKKLVAMAPRWSLATRRSKTGSPPCLRARSRPSTNTWNSRPTAGTQATYTPCSIC